MTRTPIQIIDGTTREAVSATLVIGLPPDQTEEAGSKFAAAMNNIVRIGGSNGDGNTTAPEHAHWNWKLKVREAQMVRERYNVISHFVGIECVNSIQALMIVVEGKTARLLSSKGNRLLYVDYLAVAPWNQQTLVAEPQFRALGSVMIASAMRLSKDSASKVE